MASTTSAAACMLLSGSTTSNDAFNSSFMAGSLMPCSNSMATISASAPFPTVTLDLTQNPNPLMQYHRTAPGFPLPFGGLQQFPLASHPSQMLGHSLLNHSKFAPLAGQQFESQRPPLSGHPVMQSTHNAAASPYQTQQQPSLVDTVSAATAAITADPNFTAALAAAITSIISGQPNNPANNSQPMMMNSSQTPPCGRVDLTTSAQLPAMYGSTDA